MILWYTNPDFRTIARFRKDNEAFVKTAFKKTVEIAVEQKNELIADGVRYRFRGIYTRKNGKKIVSFYNEEIKKKKDAPFYFRERLQMKEKMNTDESKKIYSLRKITVEPVYGHIKQNCGFREFLLRGLEKVKIEINLISITHNLGKIHRMMKENTISMGENFSYFAFLKKISVYSL